MGGKYHDLGVKGEDSLASSIHRLLYLNSECLFKYSVLGALTRFNRISIELSPLWELAICLHKHRMSRGTLKEKERTNI